MSVISAIDGGAHSLTGPTTTADLSRTIDTHGPGGFDALGALASAELLLGTDLPRVDTELPCQSGTTMDLWFAERGDDVERAKALCRECPLRAECLTGALRRREPWGVWGGEVFIDGVVVARKRGRGRPRKIAA